MGSRWFSLAVARAARFTLAAALLIAVLLVFAASARAYNFGTTVRQAGPEQTVFDWTTQRCEDVNIPDTPARAFTDAAGQVHLTLSHYLNRQLIGPSLNQLTVNCNITYSSDSNADPSAYDDQEWISSPYTFDGTTVYALVHDEYQGWNHPGQCNSQGHPSRPKLTTVPTGLADFDPTCWYNAVTLATSTNSGMTYTHATPPAQLAASVPYTYVPNTGPYGYFSPSNIIRGPGGYYYAMLHAETYGAQQVGACVMRTKTISDPTSWRAWGGTGFSVKFINPYTNPQPPEQHVCAPVSYDQIEKMEDSITYNTFFRKYLLVGATALYDPNTGKTIYGFYYSTSTDLVNWSERQLIFEAELPWSYQCGDDNPVLYPALLNPAPATATTQTRNFEVTGQKTYIYFTRFNYSNCVGTLDRDLIRIPIQFLASPTG